MGQPEDDGVADLFEEAGFRCALLPNWWKQSVSFLRAQTMDSWSMGSIGTLSRPLSHKVPMTLLRGEIGL